MKEDKQKRDIDIAIGMASNYKIQMEGEAASQILQAYEGVRYDSNGCDLKHQGRSLKRISEYKINDNPIYAEQNIKQQSGFAAELIQEARVNKENIRKGSKERIRTTDGIGRINDTQYDHVIVYEDGKVLDGSGSQMKFYGTKEKNGEITYRVIDKLVKDESWDRYDGHIDVPSEQYDDAKRYAQKQAEKYKKQADALREKNNVEKAEELYDKAEKYDNASKKIRQSKVSTEESRDARKNVKGFVAKEFVFDVNHGGLEVAKGAMICSSAVSGAMNIYSVATGEKTVEDAFVSTVKETTKAGLAGYGIGVAGTSIKAVMHRSRSELIRRCGNSSLPTVIASGMVETSKSIKRYADGEITESQLLEELGQKGVGMMASGYGATIGSMAGGALGTIIPIVGNAAGAIVGGFVGSMVGCAVSGTLYEGALYSLKSAELSEKRRKVIESIARKAIQENNRYIDELDEYLCNIKDEFQCEIIHILDDMQYSILNSDCEGYVSAINSFGNRFGISMDYKSFGEFDDAMNSDIPLIL